MNPPTIEGLTYFERHILKICIERYIQDIRKACLEDQGNADGAEGTVGRDMQTELRNLQIRLA